MTKYLIDGHEVTERIYTRMLQREFIKTVRACKVNRNDLAKCYKPHDKIILNNKLFQTKEENTNGSN